MLKIVKARETKKKSKTCLQIKFFMEDWIQCSWILHVIYLVIEKAMFTLLTPRTSGLVCYSSLDNQEHTFQERLID